MMVRNQPLTRGFTLIELLVALAIVSLVAVLSWQGLDNVIRLTQRVRDNDDQWEQLRAVFAQLERDLKAVHNPRNLPFAAGTPQGGTPAGTAPGSGGRQPGADSSADAVGRQRAVGRDDVIIEDENNLDEVVTAALNNTVRVQMRGTGLEIVANQSNTREGPTTVLIRWQLLNGQWRREQQNLGAQSNGLPDPAAVARAQNPRLQSLFDEPGLRVRGVGVRVWTEGRGWDTEQILGELLPPEPISPAAPTGAGTAGTGTSGPAAGNPAPTGPLRLKGVQVRLWLPNGDVFRRVFLLGQES